jgi:hypothetical protein
MRYKNALSIVLAASLGVAIGAGIKVGYALPGFLPTTDLFMFVVTSSPGILALKATSGKAGVMIAAVIRAFACSVSVGLIAGVLLHKIKYQRVFCYSALWLPISNGVLGYLTIITATNVPSAILASAQAKFGYLLWVNLCIYGWYFLALYIAFAISKRFTRNNSVKRDSPQAARPLP